MAGRTSLVTLGDLLGVPTLCLSLVWAPPGGREAEVLAANPNELVRADHYLRSGDLVCSVGVRRRTQADWEVLVAAVAASGGAGVCFGVGDIHEEVPPGLVEACRRHAVPLVTMAKGVPFSRITDFLTEVYAEDRRLAEVRIRNGQLFSLAAQGQVDPVVLRPLLAGLSAPDRLLQVSAWPVDSAPRLARLLPRAIIADAPDAVYVVSAEIGAVEGIAREVGLVCGVAAPATSALLVPAITQAHAALNVALAKRKVTGPRDLVTLEGLLFQQPPSRLAPFVTSLLDPLRAADRRHGSDLLATLQAYLLARGSLRDCARALFVHPNTVRYRLTRIREITGQDPADPQDRPSFEIAVWALAHGHRLTAEE